jgi:hypothetical protein
MPRTCTQSNHLATVCTVPDSFGSLGAAVPEASVRTVRAPTGRSDSRQHPALIDRLAYHSNGTFRVKLLSLDDADDGARADVRESRVRTCFGRLFGAA